ncbi:unnamed protein product, partial [Polarella glacialis]
MAISENDSNEAQEGAQHAGAEDFAGLLPPESDFEVLCSEQAGRYMVSAREQPEASWFLLESPLACWPLAGGRECGSTESGLTLGHGRSEGEAEERGRGEDLKAPPAPAAKMSEQENDVDSDDEEDVPWCEGCLCSLAAAVAADTTTTTITTAITVAAEGGGSSSSSSRTDNSSSNSNSNGGSNNAAGAAAAGTAADGSDSGQRRVRRRIAEEDMLALPTLCGNCTNAASRGTVSPISFLTVGLLRQWRRWQKERSPTSCVGLEAFGRCFAQVAATAQAARELAGLDQSSALLAAMRPLDRLVGPPPEGVVTLHGTSPAEVASELRRSEPFFQRLSAALGSQAAAEQLLSEASVESLAGKLVLNAAGISVPGAGRSGSALPAAGVYVLLSTMNHSCAPTARASFSAASGAE